MRLWSLHPKYLDVRGLTACWREGLLARKVLAGNTVGYRNHPQLERFRAFDNPVAVLDAYLGALCDEAEQRGYHFDRTKVGAAAHETTIPVTSGQLLYEREHLLHKLTTRAPASSGKLQSTSMPDPHPLFNVIEGGIEPWERV